MKKQRRRALMVQVLALIVIPLTLLLLVLVIGAQSLHSTALRQLIGERDARAASAAASAIAHQLLDRVTAVSSLAFQANAIGDQAHALNDAGYLFPEFDLGLAQFTAGGALVRSTGTSSYWDEEIVQMELAALLESNDLSNLAGSLRVIADPASGKKTVLFAHMMGDSSVAAGATTLEKLVGQALADVLGPDAQASVLIIDEKHELLHQSGQLYWSEAELSAHPGVIRALEGQSGATYLEQEQREHIIAYSPISGVNWALVIEEPWQSVADPFLESTELAPLLLIPALLVAVAALWFGFRQVVRPLQALEKQTAELAEGRYEAVEEPVGGIAEIRNLQTGLVQMARKVNRAQRSLRDYLGAVTVAQEDERSRLARDLHDDTIQSLVALVRKAQLTRESLAGRPEAGQLAEMETMTTMIIDDLRRVAGDLRPTYLEELGLGPAIKMLAHEAGSGADISITFTATGAEQRLSPDSELALYRIAQEALSNVAQHAGASRAEVSLDFSAKVVSLMIADDGRGFNVQESPAGMALNRHFGLLGMQERAELIGAQLVIQSTPHEGTTLAVTLAVQGNSAGATDLC